MLLLQLIDILAFHFRSNFELDKASLQRQRERQRQLSMSEFSLLPVPFSACLDLLRRGMIGIWERAAIRTMPTIWSIFRKAGCSFSSLWLARDVSFPASKTEAGQSVCKGIWEVASTF